MEDHAEGRFQSARLIGGRTSDAVAAINAPLPKALGSGITLTKGEVVGNTVRNTYTIAPGAPFDPSNRAALEASAVAQVCGAMAQMPKQGYTVDFRYEYTAAGGAKTLNISVPPSRCLSAHAVNG